MDNSVMDTLDTMTTVQSEPRMFKSGIGYKINIVSLAEQAFRDIESVRTICAPAYVQTKKDRFDETQIVEIPALSEVGGGSRNSFCQVIAEPDGRPVNIDNVLYINNDPIHSSINHGAAAIDVGTIVGFGCKLTGLGTAFLFYEVIHLSTYPIPDGANAKTIDEISRVAKITLELLGGSIRSWKTVYYNNVPDKLVALLAATESRLKSDENIPLYMDVFRVARLTGDAMAFAERVNAGEFNVEYVPSDPQHATNDFMVQILGEAQDVRNAQYALLTATEPRQRRVDALRGVELLTLNSDGSVDVSLTFMRPDEVKPLTFSTKLTEENFILKNGRIAIDRGLVLWTTTFYHFRAELANRLRKDKSVKKGSKTLVLCVSSLR